MTTATVPGRLKGSLLGVLAMLALQGALRVAVRACGVAAKMRRPRPALRFAADLVLSGEGRPNMPTRARRATSNKGGTGKGGGR